MSSPRGWAIFFVGLIFSTFLGGAIHVIFSPQRMKELVLTTMAERDPKFSLEFNEARLSLAQGWWPQFAIELQNVTIRAKDKCVTEDVIVVDQFAVPLAILSLFEKKPRLGIVHVRELKYFQHPRTCKLNNIEKVELADNHIAPLERFFRKRWTKELVNTTRYIEELAIENFRFYFHDEKEVFFLKDVSVFFDKVAIESKINFDFYPAPTWSGNQPFGATRTEMRILSDGVVFTSVGNLKEGQFSLSADWQVEDGTYNYSLRGTDLPLNNLLAFARHWGSFPSLKADIRNQWMTCQWSGKGLLREIREKLDLNIQNCRLYGDLGNMTFQNTKLNITKQSGPFPVNVHLENVPMKKGLSSFGIGSSWGMVSEFGVFTGDLFLRSPHVLEVLGDLKGSSYFLVSPKGSARQLVKNAKLKVAFDEKRYSGLIQNIELSDGVMKGELSFNISHEGVGVMQLALTEIELSHEVQKVLYGGRVESLEIFGLGQLNANGLNAFSGKVGIKKFDTHEWYIDQARLNIEFLQNIWRINLEANEFRPKPESQWRVLTYEAISDVPKKPKELFWTGVKAQFKTYFDRGSWDVKANVHGTPVSLQSIGDWYSYNNLKGEMRTNSKAKKNLWSIEGSFEKPKAVPAVESQ